MERRIGRLEAIRRRRASLVEGEPALVLSRLSAADHAELGALARRCLAAATPADPHGFGALDDATLERLCQLGGIARGHDPERA